MNVDLSEAQRFLAILDADADAWRFRTFADDGRDSGRKRAGALSDVAESLQLDNSSGRGVFVVVNEGGDKDKDIGRVRAVFADWDPPQTAAMPEGLPLEPHVIVESSRGKHHAYWLVDGLHCEAFPDVQRAIAGHCGSDPSVCNLSRVMRLPGFVHHKGQPFVSRIVHESGALPYAADQVRAAFPYTHAPAPPTGGAIVETGRHAAILKETKFLAHDVAQGHITRDEALATMRGRVTAGRYSREVPDDEIVRALDGAIAKSPATAPNTANEVPLRAVSLAGFMAKTRPPHAFVVAPYFPRRVVTLLGGHGALGKTTLALTLAAHVAAGRPWGPLTVERGRAVFLSFEDEEDDFMRALQEITDLYALPEAEVQANLGLFDGTETESELAIESTEAGAVRLTFTPMMAEVEAAAGNADLVIIDNASDTFGGNENNRRQVRAFVRRLAKLARANNAAVVLLAHINKDAAKSGGKGENYSGSTAWHNGARSRLALVESEAGIELLHEKAQYGPRLDPLRLERGRGGVLSPVVGDGGRAAAAALLARKDADTVLDLLRISPGDVTTAASGPRTTWHVLAALPEMPDNLRTRQGRKRVEAALVALERSGRIRRDTFQKANRHPGERWALAQDAPEMAA